MTHRFLKTTFFLLLITICSCSEDQGLNGLWMVDKVEVGEESMTPVRRWMEFRADKTQRSGNGWRQHSIGTWEFDSENKTLAVVNTNGYEDNNGPFSVQLEKDKMYWTRSEEGQPIKVSLSRIDELPASPGDQLLGVWDLTEVKVNDTLATAEYDPNEKRYFFIRWDRNFNIHHSPEGRLSGSYRVMGHRSEIELSLFGSDCKREYWDFEVDDKTLTLISRGEGSPIVKSYQRIHHFPQ